MTEDYLMKGRRRSMMLAVLLMLAVAAFAVPAKPGLTRLLTLTDGSTVHATLVGDEYLHYWLGADGNAYQDGGDGIYQSFDPQAYSPTAVGEYTATITLTSAGADPETVQLTGMATKAQIITDETIDFTAQNYSNEQAVTNVSGTCCAVAFDKGTNTNSNAPKYYTSGTAIRMYGGNTMTIASETKTIVKIEITFGSSDGSNTITTDEATYSNGTWTGSASSVTFTIGGTSGNRRVQKVKITYDAPTLAYYQNADGKTGSALKTAMCGIIYNRTELGYDDLWTAYQTTDVRSDGKIWDMYSNITNYDPYTDPHSNSAEGSGFNREHSFPKSWFGGEVMPMYTDLHHLYPVDGNINTRRSNNPYGETNGETYKSANDFSKLGVCTYPGYTGTVFEPADEYKGDFARTYFYMVTCYEEKLLDWYTNYGSTTEVDDVLDGNTYPGLQSWQLEMLMKWAKNDPVSEKETTRNNAVYSIQNNRNPFIDYPGLEEYIWGTMTTTAFSYDNYVQPVYKQDVAMSFSLTEATATLGVDFTEPTLTTDPDGLTVAYSSSDTDVATVDASTGAVTLVAAGTTTITATFAGDDSYNEGSAQYTLTVSDPSLVAGETLLYEGLTGYTSSGDATNDMAKDNANLNYRSWSSFTKIFAGGINNAYSNGGCLKFGSGSAVGSMTTGNISLTGSGTLTFYLKQYGSDTGKLNVTVTGATADVTQFAPSSTWTLCTVHLTGATGTVTITLATSSKRAYVDEITLTSNGKLYLANDGSNANAIAAAAAQGGKYDVTLSDRTLYKDDNWNTLALPFALSAAQIAASDLAEADIRTLSTASLSGGTLMLNFTPETGEGAVTEIAAGTPYIIKWASNSTNIVNPVFSGVTIDETVRNKECELGDGVSVTFCGTYEKLTYDDDDPSVLFLGSQNTLYYPVASASIGAQRAYFQLAGITAKASAPGDGSGNSPVRSFVLNFGDEGSGISATLNDNAEMTNDRWYTLDGRRLNGRPTTKGLYIHGGRKVLIK